jgi:hypothetical protein
LLIIADPSGFILFPLVVHSFDLVVSSVGILSIRGTRDSGLISPIEDPMAIMQKGYSVTIMLAVLTFGAVSLVICKYNMLFDYVTLLLAITFIVLYIDCMILLHLFLMSGHINHFIVAICKTGLQHSLLGIFHVISMLNKGTIFIESLKHQLLLLDALGRKRPVIVRTGRI